MKKTNTIAAVFALAVAFGSVQMAPANAGTTNLFLSASLLSPGAYTGVDIQAGQAVRVTASGQAGYGNDGGPGWSGYPDTNPDGDRYLNGRPLGRKFDAAAVLPSAPIGALLARIGSGPWFLVGSSASFTAGAGGQLYLLYNDANGGYANNSGGYYITVEVRSALSRANLFLLAGQLPPGMDTNVDIQAGQVVRIVAGGQAWYGNDAGPGWSGYASTDPNGQRYINGTPVGSKFDGSAVQPYAPIGALLGRIGSGPWFFVGSAGSFTASVGGRLYLLYNDASWGYGDNSGGYSVTVDVSW
jgi:hypothetical protein